MAGMSVGGLVSGLDTNSIVAQLTALEQAKVTREVQKKENAEKTLEKFKDLQTRLGNLAAKAAALELPDKFNVFKSSSNYEDYATVSGKEGATAGSYELVINQLATTQKVASKSFEAINTSIGPASETTITLSTSEAAKKTDSTKKSVDVKISASDTLKDVVNKINAAEGAGVKASIMTMANGENRLILTAVDTGTKGFTITEQTGGNWLTDMGIIVGNEQKAISGSSLLGLDGKAVTEDTTFDQLNTVFNKNELTENGIVRVQMPGDSWKVYRIYDDVGSEYRKIGDVLDEMNADLAGSGITAKLNNSGEIVLEREEDINNPNYNFNGLKIQIGNFNKDAVPGFDWDAGGWDMMTSTEWDALFTVKKDMGTFTERSVFANIINQGQNAIYTIDGMAVSSQSNSDDKTINGTVFTLKKVSQPGMEHIKVSLELDMSGITDKISAFIEEYNALIKFIDENAKASVKEEEDKATGKKVSKRETGAFTGDTNISSLRENLRQMLTGTIDQITEAVDNGYSTVYSSASRIGITTQKDGTLSVDKEKLTKALNSDFEGVRRLFTASSFSTDPAFKVGYFSKNSTTGVYKVYANGEVYQNDIKIEGVKVTPDGSIITLPNGTSFEVPSSGDGDRYATVTFVRGIASQLSNFVEKAKNTVDGYFKQSEKTYQARIDSIQKRVDELQIRVDNYNARITRQFSLLERSMANLQSQTSNMMAALSGASYR
jgi:flagellar hook-associated protein 2